MKLKPWPKPLEPVPVASRARACGIDEAVPLKALANRILVKL
jgi:hypothetical protein